MSFEDYTFAQFAKIPHSRITDADPWERMIAWFSECRETLRLYRFETEQEALTKTTPQWFDDDLGIDVDAWFLIPYRNTDDQEMLQMEYNCALTLIPNLEEAFRKRELTSDFLWEWGTFNCAYGYLSSTMHSHGDDMGPRRAGEGAKIKLLRSKQRQWAAHLLLKQIDAGTSRQTAELELAKLIKEFRRSGEYPEGFDAKFFELMLEKGGQLTSTYAKNLSIPKLREFKAMPIDGLPTVDYNFPRP